MPERHIKNMTATVRHLDEGDINAKKFGLLPRISLGDKVQFSMHITEGFVMIEFDGEDAEKSPVGDNHMQLFTNLAEFFEKYDTNTRFVIVEKFRDSTWEMGETVPET